MNQEVDRQGVHLTVHPLIVMSLRISELLFERCTTPETSKALRKRRARALQWGLRARAHIGIGGGDLDVDGFEFERGRVAVSVSHRIKMVGVRHALGGAPRAVFDHSCNIVPEIEPSGRGWFFTVGHGFGSPSYQFFRRYALE